MKPWDKHYTFSLVIWKIMKILQSRIQDSALRCRYVGWNPSLRETHAVLLQVFVKTIFFLTFSLMPLKSMKQGFSSKVSVRIWLCTHFITLAYSKMTLSFIPKYKRIWLSCCGIWPQRGRKEIGSREECLAQKFQLLNTSVISREATFIHTEIFHCLSSHLNFST